MKKAKKKVERLVECFLCKEPKAKEDDDYCHGCHKHVCESCCTNIDVPWGGHEPAAHKSDEEPGDDD